jgi:hypothetical protein
MHRTVRVLLLALLPLALACGGDDEEATGPLSNDLIGSWDATVIELVSAANPDVNVELIALGANGRLVLEANGDFGLSVGIPGEPTEFAGGTWSSTTVLTLVFDSGEIEGTWRFDYVLAGDLLSLTGASAEYDFDGNDVEDAAILNMTMVRL